MISMSASGNTDAAFFASSASSATPMDMLAERNTGISRAASRIISISASVCPVVATMTGIFRRRHQSMSSAVAAWLEKSMTMSAETSQPSSAA